MLTLVNVSWMFVEMFHEWENCLLVLSYSLTHGSSSRWYDLVCEIVCQSWCQAFVMLIASSHQVCQPIACSVSAWSVSPGRMNLSSPLHTLVLHTQKHVPLLLLVYRLVFHAISFRVVGHRITSIRPCRQIWIQFTCNMLEVWTWETHWTSLSFCSFLIKLG